VSRRRRFPLRVESLLAEAGASAYAWYEEEVEARVDPGGRARTRCARIETLGFYGALVVATGVLVVASGLLVPLAVAVGVYVLVAVVAGRGGEVAPWWSTVVLTGVVMGLVATGGVSVWFVAVSVGVGACLRLVSLARYRDSVAFGFYIVSAVAAAAGVLVLGPSVVVVAAALAYGLAGGIALALFAQGRLVVPLPLRLRAEQFTWTLPDPPSGLPFLLRPAVRRFEADAGQKRRQGLRPPRDAAIDMKKVGAAWERQTALLLLGLRRGKWTRVVHDVVIPGATRGANADHVVLARSGGWVLDSKRYGSTAEPGRVERDDGGSVVHRTDEQWRDLDQTLRTVAWAVRSIRTTMQLPMRGLVVVHNADVEAALSVVVPGPNDSSEDVVVDILEAQYLVAYLDSAVPVLSARELSGALWGFQSKLTSATTGRAPKMVAPIGGGPRSTPPATPPPLRRDAREHHAVSGVTSPEVSEPEPEPTPGIGGEVAAQVAERWEQVGMAEPAAPDDVPGSLRMLHRGSPISRIGFTEDWSDVLSIDLVALSGPCHGDDGPFVWVCNPQQWQLHRQTGEPVMASTVALENVAIRPDDPEGA